MSKNKKILQALLGTNEKIGETQFSRKTINSLVRCLLEPIVTENTASLIFTRIKNRDGLDGIVKRLEYSKNVEMYDFLDSRVINKDDFIEFEFILLTSARYNAILAWDYSQDLNKKQSKIYFVVNSRKINEAFEVLQEKSKIDFKEKFYSFKPERRENELLNDAVLGISDILNSSIKEIDFRESELLSPVADRADVRNFDEEYSKKTRHIAHEIRNQLSMLDIYSRILEKKFGENNSVSLIKKSISLISMQLNELRKYDNLQLEERLIEEVIPISIEMFEEVVKQNDNTILFVDTTLNNDNRKVFIDEGKFLSVLNNIIKNANESTREDEIVVKLSKDETHAKISIQNHGTPILKEDQEKIFKDGFSTKKDGFGVGLNVCKKYLAEQMGTLEFVSSSAEKTEFLIKLPLVENM